MSDLVNNLEFRRLADENDKKLTFLINTLRENGVGNLDKVLDLVSNATKTKSEKTLSDLKQKWKSYMSPMLSLEDFLELVNEYKTLESRREEQRDLDKYILSFQEELDREPPRLVTVANSNATDNHPPYIHFHHPDNSATARRPEMEYERKESDLRFILHGAEGRMIGCYPETGNKMSLPLKYQRTVNLDTFAQEITYYSLTELVQLDVTLSNIMDKGKVLGLTKKDLSIVFKQLIEKHYKDYHFTIANLKSPKEIFEKTILLINSEQVLINVKNQLKNFSRSPGTTVSATWSRYVSLSVTRLECEEPSLSRDQIVRKAERLANFLIPNMTNKQTREKYFQWQTVRKNQGETLSGQEICNYLALLENGEEIYKLTETVSPGDNISVDKVHLFLAGADMMMSDAAWKEQPRGSNGRWMRGAGRGNRDPSRGRGDRGRGRGHNRGNGGRGGHQSRRDDFTRSPSRDRRPETRSQSRDTHRDRSASGNRRPHSDNYRDRSRSASGGRSHSHRGRGGRGRGRARGRGFSTPASRLRTEWTPHEGRGRGRGHRPQTPGRSQCLRCLRWHPTEECRTYSVTTNGPCYSCGEGAHPQAQCRGRQGNK